MTPIVAAAGIAFDDGGRVLLAQRAREPSRGVWSVPGGKVEAGESLSEACAREFLEETGLHVEVGPRVDVVERIGRDGDRVTHHYVIVDYLVRVTGGVLQAGDDAGDVRWVDREEMRGLELTSGLDEVIGLAAKLLETWTA